jgi:hypothetical protein
MFPVAHEGYFFLFEVSFPLQFDAIEGLQLEN